MSPAAVTVSLVSFTSAAAVAAAPGADVERGVAVQPNHSGVPQGVAVPLGVAVALSVRFAAAGGAGVATTKGEVPVAAGLVALALAVGVAGARGVATGVTKGEVGVGVGSGPGSDRPPPGIHVARGSMSSALRREVATPTPPPK